MTVHEAFLPSSVASPVGAAASLSSWISPAGRRIAAWATACADHYAAAAMYEQLSRLSDAELKHRGLSRDTLARDIG